MIWLTLATLRARWGQALTVTLLASLAVAGAVAVPVYVDLARRIVVADDLAAATWSQRTLSTTDPVQLVAEPGNVAEEQLVEEARRRNFEHAAPAALSTPGFRTVFSVRYPITVDGGAADPGERGVLEFRQDFCAQVRITSGRCVLAAGEVLVSADLASRGLPVNATAAVTALRYVPGIPGDPGIWVPAGRPCRLAVVGVYRPIDAADPYWGRPSAALTAESSLRLLTSRRAVAACDHVQETQEAIAVPLPGTFAADRVDQVREAVEATIERAPGDIVVSSAVGALLSAIDRDRDLVSRVPTGAAVPFVALCWFVLFLAIAHTAAARRRELGAVKIRGVTARDQWWLAAAESLTPVLLGAAAGYLLGHAGVWAYGRVLFGVAATVPLSSRPWAYALVATLGAVIVSVLALRTDLAASVTDLLRRVPARGNRWAGVTLAVLVVAVAAVAVAQTRLQPGGPDGARGGLAPLAPALTLMALGLLSALVVDPLATRFGLRALRKGRVGLAVGALHLGRRGHGSRLLALVVVAVALLTFAAAAADLADGARHRQAELVVGADRVLTVTDVDPVGLLRTVRAVDPAGTYAMAVISVDAQPSGRKLMALDSTRLAAAARWPDADGQPGA
ncbi:MAG TPA: ABC transporter permease, partial [Micromonosporaceae bacterium]